jgi:hypothetical protein
MARHTDLARPDSGTPARHDTAGAEAARLAEDARREKNWKRWGPYLSERQWGTVREDYSEHGSCWDYFPHDHARSRAYRWGEDGLFGICDRQARICFALALWNEKDPILKERLFGLTGPEGNHGEDVKELYYYVDATPTASYLAGLYKYPQREYPYARLVEENRRRGKHEPELELIDTGVLDGDAYYDVKVEYAKADEEDIQVRITVDSRSGEAALGLGRARRGAGTAGARGHGRGQRARVPPRARRVRARVREHPRAARAAVHRERDESGALLRREFGDPLHERRVPPPRRQR